MDAPRAAPGDQHCGGQDDATVYTSRHSHPSALYYAGFTPSEAAARMGHGLTLHWKTYAHVIETLSAQRYPDLDALIMAARENLMFPHVPRALSSRVEHLAEQAAKRPVEPSRRADSNR